MTKGNLTSQSFPNTSRNPWSSQSNIFA